MTIEEFDKTRGDIICQHCGRRGLCRKQVPINSWEPVCPGCRQAHPISGVQYLKQSNVRRRKEYPMGDSVNEVWARFDDRCVVCSETRDVLQADGVGLERQHVAPYAIHGHQGPLVPMCTICHNIATQLQKMRAFNRRVREVSDVESVLGSGTGVPRFGLSSDPLPATTEDPTRELEAVPGGHAND